MDFTLLKEFMDSLTAWRIPGNTVSVCLDGKEVFNYQSGFADVENGIKMSPEHLFFIYSCSKVTTVTAGLQLLEKGLFRLDDPVYDFISEYRNVHVKAPDGSVVKAENPITLRHLFTMTSGLTYDTDTPAFEKARAITNGKMDTLTVIRCLAEDPLSFEPGTRWQYSLSHDVLGGVIEAVTGKKLSTYVKENIFEPLGMNNSFYHHEGVTHRMAQQYHFKNSDETNLAKLQSADAALNEKGGVAVNVGLRNHDIFGGNYDSGGAGITTSVGDYSRLCCALSCGGQGILRPETINLLRTNQLLPGQMTDFNWEQLRGYGYGLGVRTLVDKSLEGIIGNVGEFGWGGAAGSTVLVDPEYRLSVFYSHHMLNPRKAIISQSFAM